MRPVCAQRGEPGHVTNRARNMARRHALELSALHGGSNHAPVSRSEGGLIMTNTVQRPTFARSLLAPLVISAALLAPTTGDAQYFGRNKVPYERFDFQVLRTPHWDVHYYREEAVAAHDAARMLERWNTRLSGVLAHPLSGRKPVILYADHPDFQQTNVISGTLTEGTGGVTESLLDRMVMPMTGYYAETDHVLGHEAVHVFQYDIANRMEKLLDFGRMPLWFVEGMAEYLSVGPEDSHTAMWLRDALQRNDLPTINQLTTSGRYFPYRFGEALWAFIGGTFGDEKVHALFRASLEHGIDQGIIRALGMRSDTLSKRWHEAIRTTYGPLLEGRTAPRETGRILIAPKPDRPEYYVGPAISPDGRQVAFFHTGVRGVELRLMDAATGEDRGTLSSPGLSTRFDALSFLYSAGSWSPDGKRLAFVSYSDGDNEIDIVNVESRDIEQRIKPANIGAVSTVSWSPDGSRLVFSGMVGGVSDLYLYEFSTGMTRRLTNDLNADMQPAWSPDGSTIVFVTDRTAPQPEGMDSGSDFQRLSHAPLRLALIEANTGRVQVLPGFTSSKHISPQFSADGRSVLFISDRGGYTDLYRLDIASGALSQVTRTSTGISGVAATSPALSVARETGTAVFSVFEQGGLMIASLSQAETTGEPVAAPGAAPQPGSPQSAALLPGGKVGMAAVVANYVSNYSVGLPSDTVLTSRDYNPGLKLAYIGPPSLGVGIGGPFGTTVQGGASAYFSDILGNHFLGVAAQASGTLRDIGGQVLYINSERRWTWGASVERSPYLYAYTTASQTSLDYVLEHVAVTGGSLLTQFARNTTSRLELSAGYKNYSFYRESRSLLGNGDAVELPAPNALGLGTASVAYVGDDATMGFTSPIAGTRFRFEASPTVGSLNYQTYLADMRRYALLTPFTFALRGLHFGRYGRDGDSQRIGSVFIGDPTLVRGYSFDSFNGSECTAGSGALAESSCPQFDRLLGSRVGIVNAELRLLVFGQYGMGLFDAPLPPLEIAPFFDAGVAWTGTSAPNMTFDQNSSDRTPVMSAGITSRLNLFGFAILEVFHARPFNRPGRGGVWGFSLQPGW
jgi:hypothetical protein